MTGGYRQISLEWSAIPATDEFEVLRSTARTGPFENYTGTIHGNSFTDTGVSDGMWYYYKVRPAIAGSIKSGANAAEPFPLPPDDGERVTSIGLPAQAGKLRVNGPLAYVAAGTAGLMVIDISRPDWPRYMGTVNTGGNAKDLVISGNYLYLANGSAGLAVYDLTNRLSPTKVGECTSWSGNTIGDATAVSIVPSYNRVFVLDSSGDTAIFAVDVSTPSSPTGVSRYWNATYHMTDLEAVVFGSPAYFLIYAGTMPGGGACLLELYESAGADPTLYFYRTYTNAGYTPTRVTVSGNYIYALGYANSFLEPPPPYELMILSNAVSFTPPALVGQYSTSLNGNLGDIRADAASGRVYTADGIGMRVFDVSNPASPQVLKYYDTPGSPSGVEIDSTGSHVFVGSGVYQFQSVDLTSPVNPTVVGTWGTSGVYSTAVRGPYAFVSAAGPPRLQVINVDIPTGPTAVGSLALSAGSNVKLSGPYAFVTGGSQGVHILDITNPASPTLVSTVPLSSGSANAVEVRGDYMYVAATGKLYIFDIGVPTAPLWVGVHDADGASSINDVKIRGNRAYITDGAYFQANNLKILDITDPTNPLLITKTSSYPGQTINRLALDGDWAFVTDQAPATSGFYAIGINPGLTTYRQTYGPCPTVSAGNYGIAQGVAAYGGYAYVADSATGATSTTAVAQVSLSGLSVFPPPIGDASRVKTLDWSTTNGNSVAQDVVLSGKYAYVSDSTFGLKVIRLVP